METGGNAESSKAGGTGGRSAASGAQTAVLGGQR